MARTCTKCSVEKDETLFPKNQIIVGRKNPKRFLMCKQCKKDLYKQNNYEYKRTNRVYFTNLEVKRAKRYKDEAISQMGGCCTDCKQSFPNQVYDFHHLDPSIKEGQPAQMFYHGWDKVENEVIAKCILLCANCHRIRHIQIRSESLQLKEVQSKNSTPQVETLMEPQKVETK